jgi:hypothetical protein
MRLEAPQPILTNDAMGKIRHIALFTMAHSSRTSSTSAIRRRGARTEWRRRSRRLPRRPRTRFTSATTS